MADVSKGTVSKALNNKPGIGDETRQRILNIVEEMGYRPDSSAKALSNRKTSNIGLIIPHEAGQSLDNAYWPVLVSSITEEAAENGYNLMLFTPRREGALDEMYDSLISSNKTDGLIIGSELLDRKQIDLLEESDIPFILLGKHPEADHHFVDIDNAFAARSMTEYLLNRGYRKIALLTGPGSYYYNRMRLDAYKEAMENRNLPVLHVEADEYDSPSVTRALDRIYSSGPRPDAIFAGAGGDFLYTILEKLRELPEAEQPEGICVFDDDRSLDFIGPGLTAVRQPVQELGRAAAKGILYLIENPELKQIRRIFKTTIIERGSCPVLPNKDNQI